MSTSKNSNRLSKDDSAMLLIDHQAGLVSRVHDFEPSQLKNCMSAAYCAEIWSISPHKCVIDADRK